MCVVKRLLITLGKDAIYSGPLFWEQQKNTALAAIAPVISTVKILSTFTAGIYLVSVGLGSPRVIGLVSNQWLIKVGLCIPNSNADIESVDCCMCPNGR